MGIQGVTRGYKGLQGATRGDNGLQAITNDYKNFFSNYNVRRYFFLVYFAKKSKLKKSLFFDQNDRLTFLENF